MGGKRHAAGSRANQVVVIFITAVICMTASAQADGPHWTYQGHGGPAEWGSLDPAFSACRVGKLESPIDIRGATIADLPAIQFHYKPSPLTIIDNGHTVQVNYAPGSSMVARDVRYELVQFHFHRPSEEKIHGKAHAMVVHLVHRNAAGKLAVVAVLLDQGGASPLMDTILDHLPREKQKEVRIPEVTIDATGFLPPERGYYTFQGSLTTPPCTEGVTWFVLKTPLRIAGADISSFGRLYPMNARPTQPLNHRLIEATK